MKSISLYYREGGSDKVYNVSIQPIPSGGAPTYNVAFAYGRRGSALNTGIKNSTPFSLSQAEKMYDKLVNEKLAKGYKISASSTTPPTIPITKPVSKEPEVLPQLLNSIDEEDVETYLNDDDYILQEKYDGRRMTLEKNDDGLLITRNKKGQMIPVPSEVLGLMRHDKTFIVDGENMGDYYVIFDVLSYDGESLVNRPVSTRVQYLDEFEGYTNIHIADVYRYSAKRAALEIIKNGGGEGIVFKHRSSHYTAGRPASKGPQLKFKFYATASFIVKKVNTQRSVLLRLITEENKAVDAGNVTIPVNHPIPEVGDVVEVRYLYAYKESGAVYQPVYLGKRDDVTDEECTTSQLKYKSKTEEE